MKTISTEAERKLLSAVKSAKELVDTGMTPTDAIVKVAQTHRLPAGFVPLVVQAYNTGQTGMQRDQGGSVLDKLADFELANTEQVLSTVYPSEVEAPNKTAEKQAVSAQYAKPAVKRQTKAANVKLAYDTPTPAPYPRDESVVFAKQMGKVHGIKKAIEEQRHQYGVSKDRFVDSLRKVAGYFRTSGSMPFAEANQYVELIFGDPGKYVMKTAAQMGQIKEASTQYPMRPIDRTAAPFSLIADVIKSAQTMMELHRTWQAGRLAGTKQATELVGQYYIHGDAPPPNILGEEDTTQLKQAAGFISGAIGGALTAPFRFQNEVSKNTANLVNSADYKLSDPEHENELRAIQARSELADFMSNDDIIKAHPPEDVISAYNDIAKLSPQAATQPAIMRPLLRKRLSAGSIEPFEAQEMANIEKTLTDINGSRGSSSGVLGGGSILS